MDNIEFFTRSDVNERRVLRRFTMAAVTEREGDYYILLRSEKRYTFSPCGHKYATVRTDKETLRRILKDFPAHISLGIDMTVFFIRGFIVLDPEREVVELPPVEGVVLWSPLLGRSCLDVEKIHFEEQGVQWKRGAV